MSDSLIVGLSGYSRSGKNSAAEALVQYGWKQAAFADKLREFLLAVDPVIPGPYGAGLLRLSVLIKDVGWEYAKDHYPEVRALLQRTGTEAGRKLLGSDVWVNALLAEFSDVPALVVTDVRFPNEAQAVADRGGVLIRVRRPGVGPAKDRVGRVHESEVALDGWAFDHTLINDGSVRDLHLKLYGVADLVQLSQAV
ncbi:deoxynucleoside monophosphate kinase [Streptomyces phage R4]|uniref:Deoxynucleoside monophosphate kinase n=2 Tax=Arequatrovirus TaxID=1982881 RepID=K4I005_9CAUD|nr:deoxynucleoside monophosphate kinase [Streptomyces phage R4]YP_009591521.1 deoxynucleoside monophosphate kinase [Streptomyces phage phiELB20]AFO10928.1 deoxynucleoside monophosphate kinase [Streptomyces phage phiELB20]AFU62117.1 deoxynucleoside monophosphate kinase [Streptomyces phage R4]